MYDFSNKLAVITGGAAGIGYCTAKKLAEGKARVVILDVSKERVDDAVQKLTEDGLSAAGYVCDIANRDSVATVCEKLLEEQGCPDIIVNNAGITRDAMMHKMSFEQWDQVIAVNLTGMFNVLRYLVPPMRKVGGGSIVNVSSTGFFGNIGQVNYTAAKAGVIGLTHTLAKELARFRIRVNAIMPGGTKTDIIKTVPAETLAQWEETIPLRRLAEPEEQAGAICFLCSQEASYITGQSLIVDGGVQMR